MTNYEPGGLKTSNDELMTQLQLGLVELKTMVSRYPNRNDAGKEGIGSPQASKQQRSCKKNVDIKENIHPRRSMRITSTPKNTKKSASLNNNNASLIKEVHSLLISDTGNLKPRQKINLNASSTSPVRTQQCSKSKVKSPKSILRSSKRKAPRKGYDIGNLKPTRKTPLSKSNKKGPVKSILQASKKIKTPHKGNRVCFSPMVNKNVRSKMDVDTNVTHQENADTTMVGYDWIAAMLDNDASINEQPDHFFEELNEFRKANWNECKSVKTADTNISLHETSLQLSPVIKHTEKENFPLCCTGNGAYMIDNRLNLLPIHGPYSACPTCKSKPQSQCDADGYVRVSIPRSTIKSPYKLRPHRRKSFDPSDSVALSMHCLAGWQASKPSCVRGPTNIDLASHSAKPGLRSVKALKNATSKCK